MMAATDSFALQFQKDGFIEQAFRLAQPEILPALLADTAIFDDALDRQANRSHVPYIMTDAIAAVANDPKLVEVVERILETDCWVMWGPNIRRGTPNQAHRWHVDLESLLWPSLTVAIGLRGCHERAATWFIPESSHIRRGPGPAVADSGSVEALRIARSMHRACREPQRVRRFADGSFYVFNARCWHRGDPGFSADRIVLFLHYQRGDLKRVPYMLDYDRDQWSREACPYLVSPRNDKINRRVCRPPMRHVVGSMLYRLRRRKQ